MLKETGFVDVDAWFGADGRVERMGTAMERAEPDPGIDDGQGSGQTASWPSGWQPEADCGVGVEAVGAVAGVRVW